MIEFAFYRPYFGYGFLGESGCKIASHNASSVSYDVKNEHIFYIGYAVEHSERQH